MREGQLERRPLAGRVRSDQERNRLGTKNTVFVPAGSQAMQTNSFFERSADHGIAGSRQPARQARAGTQAEVQLGIDTRKLDRSL